MGYLLDRQYAFRDADVVAVISVRQRGVRSHVFLRDGRFQQTLTRPRTLRRRARSLTLPGHRSVQNGSGRATDRRTSRPQT